MSYCHVTLYGNIGQDPKISASKNGTQVATWSVAYNPNFDKTLTNWISCVAFGKNAEFAAKFLSKGCRVIVEGSLEIEKYDDGSGIEKTFPKVVVREIHNIYERLQDGQQNTSKYASHPNVGKGQQRQGGYPNNRPPQQNNNYQQYNNAGGQQPQNAPVAQEPPMPDFDIPELQDDGEPPF